VLRLQDAKEKAFIKLTTEILPFLVDELEDKSIEESLRLGQQLQTLFEAQDKEVPDYVVDFKRNCIQMEGVSDGILVATFYLNVETGNDFAMM